VTSTRPLSGARRTARALSEKTLERLLGGLAGGGASPQHMGALRTRLTAAARTLRGPRDPVAPQLFAGGAFYSPLVNAREVLSEPHRSRIWPAEPDDPPGLDLRGAAQLDLLRQLASHRLPGGGPWEDPANDQFPRQDAALLYAMVRRLAPERIVEVGSGWSTTVTARAIVDGGLSTRLTCIEPYPRPFVSEIPEVSELRRERVELTPQPVFDELGAGDVLFIDSSHVVKTGSDVVHQLLEVVPRLADGVVVHVHDIFLPQDYPQGWVQAGFGWTEQYLLQAYLSGSARAHVVAANRWLSLRHPTELEESLGPVGHDGSSFWFATGPAPARRAI